jgi:hypothetical protein
MAAPLRTLYDLRPVGLKAVGKMRPKFGLDYCNWPSNKASTIYAALRLLKALNPDFERWSLQLLVVIGPGTAT